MTSQRAQVVLHVARELILAGRLVVATFWLTQAIASEPSAPGQSAAALMQAAHNGRAVWHQFPGFRAAIKAQSNGQSTTGQLTVTADGQVHLHLAESTGFEWVERSLESLVNHRLPGENALQDVEFADQEDQHPLGRLIRSKSQDDKSLWRVQGDVLTEVHRFGSSSHFIISVSDVYRTPEGKHLPQDFTVTTWVNATGQIASSRQVHTEWKRIGSLDLPTVWWSATNSDQGTRLVQRLELSEHQVLPIKTALSR